jgi:G3E family GTPase
VSAGGRIPVLVVGGFLGSGKTSLLRRMLTGAPDTAVIVNEFGAVGLDHDLLRACEERVELVGGGCACCTRRADLVSVLREILGARDGGGVEVNRVVIETSGLADPAPIVFTITSDPMLRHHFDVERLIVTVAAPGGYAQLVRHAEVAKQVLVADELVITKRDLVEQDACDALAAELAALNPAATIRTALHGFLDERPAHVGTRTARRPRLGADAPRADRSHTDDVSTLILRPHGRVDWVGFAVWLSMLLHARGEDILRVKGLLALEDGSVVSINGVQHVVHPPEHLPREAICEALSRVVFITRGLEAELLRRSFEAFQRLCAG